MGGGIDEEDYLRLEGGGEILFELLELAKVGGVEEMRALQGVELEQILEERQEGEEENANLVENAVELGQLVVHSGDIAMGEASANALHGESGVEVEREGYRGREEIGEEDETLSRASMWWSCWA